MKIRNLAAISAMAIATTACSSLAEPMVSMDAEATNLEPCLLEVMAMMEGEWAFQSFTARMSGGYSVSEMQSAHTRVDENTWASSILAGDAEPDENSSYERVRGDQIFEIVDNVEQLNEARSFSHCEGPNDVGRIITKSTYRLPLDDERTEFVTFKNFATYSPTGNHFTEDVINEAGDVVAYRSGVSVPLSEQS